MKGSTFGLGLKYFKTASSPFSVCRVEAFQDSDDSKLVRSHLTCWILPLMIARLAVGITVGGGRGRCDHHSGILPFGMLLALRGRGYGVIIAVVTRLIFQTPRGGGGEGGYGVIIAVGFYNTGFSCPNVLWAPSQLRKTNEPVLQTKNELSYSILDQNCCCRSRLKWLTSGKAKATATAATTIRWFLNQSQTASRQPVM